MRKLRSAVFVLVLSVLSIAFIYGCATVANQTALYKLTLSVAAAGSTGTVGSISAIPSAEGNLYLSGTAVSLDARALAAGYMFQKWEGSITGETTPTNIIMDGDKNVTARFISTPSAQYTLNLSISPDSRYGTVEVSAAGPYAAGTVVLLTAEARNGCYFVHWSGDLSGSAHTVALTMNGNKNVTAVFSAGSYGPVSSTSFYDGTYSGPFVYVHYNGVDTDGDGNIDRWDAITDQINLTVTLSFLTRSATEIGCKITYAESNDTRFGVGGSGWDPFAAGSVAALPDHVPTTPANPSVLGEGLRIALPHGVITTQAAPGDLDVSWDGLRIILSNNPQVNNAAWFGYTDNGSFPPPSTPPGSPSPPVFVSWRLTKL